ncbi:MAG: N-acetylglucosamine-6-phosphate deacetylase [Anaerolineales bacterium]|nr:N-acetylglucosamine-6-phosphate deacetylase [Anaerolineales bacterium]
MLYIAHARLLTPAREIPDGAVLIDGGRILAAGPAAGLPAPAAARRLEAGGAWLTPGFIDLQFNGGFGHDFTSAPETIWPVAARLPEHGVTAFLPTIVTAPLNVSAAARAVLRAGPPAGFVGAAPLGLHIEGPFLNPGKRGAHNPAHLRLPDLAAAADWAPEAGVRLVTLAAELPGGLELARALAGRGVCVSLGHTLATYAEAQAALAAGVRYATHLFNAMRPLDHREPGLIGLLLTQPEIVVGLIPDGHHVHPALVDLAWRARGPHGLNLVTDAMGALGMPPGRYPLAGYDVIVDGQTARLEDGRLAGSLLRLDAAVRNLMAFTGCALADAVATVTTTPARLLGLAGERGQIAPGYVADLTLLAPDLTVLATLTAGSVAYAALPGWKE